MARVPVDDAIALVTRTLMRAGAPVDAAASTARALVLAEAQGLGSHGLSRIAQYTTHLANGRINRLAVPRIVRQAGGVVLIDADSGFAFPACEQAIATGVEAARAQGIAIATVRNSHHAGVIVDHLRPVVAARMVGIGFANSPSAMPMAGGRHPIFGTNPIAAAFPRRNADALLIDLSLSEVARGKLAVAAKAGKSIPVGWALDPDGNPTTDPAAGLVGSMLAIGGATSSKGALLALMVELLVTALIGSGFGFEASSFFLDEGNRPRLGQVFLIIDPARLAGSDVYLDRVEMLVTEMLRDDGVRMPGARREALRKRAEVEGIEVPDTLRAV